MAVQSLHYLTLALLVPPLLSLFAEPGSLEYEGGAFNVGTPKNSASSRSREPDDRCIGMLMDWREMAGRPTFRRLHGEERWSSFTGAWSGGRKVAEGPWYMGPDGRGDYMRGWILAACWVLASTAE